MHSLTKFSSHLVRLSTFLILGILMAVIAQTNTAYAVSTVLPDQITSRMIVQSSAGVRLMKPEEIRAIIQQAANAWMTGDADGFARLFAPDGVFIVPGNRWVGQTAIRQVAAEFAQTHSDVKIEIQKILIEGDRAVVEWSWEDTDKTTGSRQPAEDAIAVDFQHGRITRWREYIDTETTTRTQRNSS